MDQGGFLQFGVRRGLGNSMRLEIELIYSVLIRAEYGHGFDFNEQAIAYQPGRVYGGAGGEPARESGGAGIVKARVQIHIGQPGGDFDHILQCCVAECEDLGDIGGSAYLLGR